jgi:hypothetical protein
MRILLALAILASVALTPACKTPGTPPGPVVSGAIDCAEAGVRAVAIDILPSVATALATGDYVVELTKLVEKYGEAALDCAVAKLSTDAAADARLAAGDRQAPVRAANGKAWLASRPVKLAGY